MRATLEDALVHTVINLGHDVERGVAHAHAILDLAQALVLELNTWEAQNQYYVLITTSGARRCSATAVRELRRLGERLTFHLQEWETLAAHAA